jgi:hypothetical protein
MGHAAGCFAGVLLLSGSAVPAADVPSADAGVAPKSAATVIYEKIVAADTKESVRAYQEYQAALDKDRDKVLKALQKAEAELNDVHKYADMTITERAKAIEELQAKEKAVKAGALGDGIVDDANGDPLGMGHAPQRSIVGTWEVVYDNNNHEVIDIDAKLHVHLISSTWSRTDFDLVYADGKFTATRSGLVDCYSFDAAGNLTDARGPMIHGTLTRVPRQ